MSAQPQHGRFIVLEGGEGAGKSTQARLLADKLLAAGIPVHLTREVGGAPLAEEIRQFWLADRADAWDGLTELLLIFAARREHLVKTIWPKLQAGTWIISDRFVSSSVAYQGVVMGLGVEKVLALYKLVADDFKPDLTLLLDVPISTGKQRIAARNLDRYERQPESFHEQLRQAYLQQAQGAPKDWQVIDASAPTGVVAAALWQAIEPLRTSQQR